MKQNWFNNGQVNLNKQNQECQFQDPVSLPWTGTKTLSSTSMSWTIVRHLNETRFWLKTIRIKGIKTKVLIKKKIFQNNIRTRFWWWYHKMGKARASHALELVKNLATFKTKIYWLELDT